MAGTGYRPGGIIELGIERRAPAPAPLPPLSTDEKLEALLGLLTTLGGYGITAVATLLALLSAWVACNQYFLLSSWGRTGAEIVSGEVYTDGLRNNTGTQTRPSPILGFRCTVRFQANGRLYESQADIGYKESAKSEMIDWYLRFPAGGSTAIAYARRIPARSN